MLARFQAETAAGPTSTFRFLSQFDVSRPDEAAELARGGSGIEGSGIRRHGVVDDYEIPRQKLTLASGTALEQHVGEASKDSSISRTRRRSLGGLEIYPRVGHNPTA